MKKTKTKKTKVAAPAVPDAGKVHLPEADYRPGPIGVILFALTFLVPVAVLPGVLDNAFNTPKNVLIAAGAAAALAVYLVRFLLGKEIPLSRSGTPILLLFIVGLNLFSFFYTANYYYTAHAALMNISCLLLLYFFSLYACKRHDLLLVTVAVSGLLVSIETYLQFFGYFVLFRWAQKGIMVMGTVGNSNYLGAYLMFPLFALAALVFLWKGNRRLIPAGLFLFVIGALLFTRARAAWMGFFLALPVFLILMMRLHRFSLKQYVLSRSKPVAAYGILVVMVLVAAWAVAPERFHAMMGYRNVTNPDTLVFRIKKYSPPSILLFQQNPLFGTGLWSYRNLVYKAQSEIARTDPDFFKNHPEPKPRRVHNEYLEILNDGGLLAAAALLLLFLVVMRNGWAVIRNPEIDLRDRIISATAFSSLIAVMLNAMFFFPFRLNSTMLMTVLMMGILEGLHIRHYRLIRLSKGWKTPLNVVLIPAMALLLAALLWFTAVKPLMGEIEHFKYKQALGSGRIDAAEKHLLKAIDYDPQNTGYCMWASQLYFYQKKNFGKADEYLTMALLEFNGDIVPWAAYFLKGMLKFQTGSPFDAKIAFERSLYFNPNFNEARQKLDEVNRIIKDHDQVLIKFR